MRTFYSSSVTMPRRSELRRTRRVRSDWSAGSSGKRRRVRRPNLGQNLVSVVADVPESIDVVLGGGEATVTCVVTDEGP